MAFSKSSRGLRAQGGQIDGKPSQKKQQPSTVPKRTCKTRVPDKQTTKELALMSKFKNIDYTKQGSDPTPTIQTLQFPDANDKYTELHKRDECGDAVVKKKITVGSDSTSNTHFRYGVQTINMRERPCTSSSRESQSTLSLQRPSGVVRPPNSQEMIDSQHKHSAKRLNLRTDGEWQKPCRASFNINAPPPRIGMCPKNFEELARMSKTRQKFFLTQDPRRTHCLVNPDTLRRKPLTEEAEFKVAAQVVKHADNLCLGSESDTSESFICDVVDVDNPFELDFQGMDFKNTYQSDEQQAQNQNTYWRVLRFMERKAVKADIAGVVEAEKRKDMIAVPAMFKATITDEVPPLSTPSESPRLAKLYRTYEKPVNKARIEFEKDRRQKRYKDIFVKKTEREKQRRKEREAKEAEQAEVKATTVAQNAFQEAVLQIDDAIERSFITVEEVKSVKHKRRAFPKTLEQTRRYQKKIDKDNCERRDAANVKKEFFLKRSGKEKQYPDAELDIICEGSVLDDLGQTPSEESSDDEDTLHVGKVGESFKLRGFHFKHGDGLRGKLHKHEIMAGKRTQKCCLTREEWLNELAPRKEPVKLDIETGIQRLRHPDDPELELFPKKAMYKQHLTPTKSSIREYIEKRLGLHYYCARRKNLKLVKPRLQYKVRKFNLIKFVFPNTHDKFDSLNKEEIEFDKGTTLDYIKGTLKQQNKVERKKKLARLNLLGLPCVETKKTKLQMTCEEDTSSESGRDWVPEPELAYLGDVQAMENDERHLAGKDVVPIQMRGNMPAPIYREKTLQLHPRRPRNYAEERIPSGVFHDAVRTTHVPIVAKIEKDKIAYANVRRPKRPYTDLLEARHHHDHWNPTQNKGVHVHYHTKVVEPKVTEVKATDKKQPVQKFKMANPPCKKTADTDFSKPMYDFDAMVRDHLALTHSDSKTLVKEQVKDLCHPFDFVFHSRDPEEVANLNFPGHQEYLDFLRATKELLYQEKESDADDERLFVDKQKMIGELEEDLKSIEGCLTSLSSSECTSMSNDSGSFLLIEGETKLPLDYMRKPLVPFEELERSRFHIQPIDVEAEERNPFRLLPFSGQLKAQQNILSAKDSFFTYNTRLRNGLRLRLQVPVVDVRNTLIGRGSKKYYGAVITDIDENYIEELKTRAIVKSFNFKTGIELLKDAMRMKFESLLIQGQIVRTKIFDRLNEKHWETMRQTKLLYEKLFAKWEKSEYESAMSVVYQVKSYYEMTDELKRQYRDLDRELMMQNMDIVFIEGHWIRCIMLQNFHYLLGDQEWRMEHDWIHKVPKKRLTPEGDSQEEECEEEDVEYELESYDESIAKRSIVNIRKRDKDDAWAIRSFYYDVYMQNLHPILQVFPDAASFLQGIENLKNKTFVLLLEMHYTLAVHTELQGRLETFMDWCAKDLKEKEEYVARKSAKKFFMEARAHEMEQRTLTFLDKPIEESFNDMEFNKHRAVIAEVWRRIVPANKRGSGDAVPKPSDMVAMISDTVMEVLTKFEHMDINKVRETETQLRKRRRYLEKLSSQAYQVERRIDMEMKKVCRNLEPPYRRPKRVGKLPRMYIKRKVAEEVVPEKVISEHTKYFIRAFHEDGDLVEQVEARESLMVVDTMQEQIVPFYFDHFLKLNGYTPNYNFKTQIDIRDGPEIERFRVREVVPDVLEKLAHWESTRRKVMEENIQRNPKMYEDVM